MRSATSVDAPAGARISILVALLVGALASSCVTPGTPSPEPTPGPSAEASPTSAATGSAPSSPSEPPLPGPCEPASLALRVIGWSGSAGHRVGTVELRNAGTDPCLLFALARPQLVDAVGTILIDGDPPGASTPLVIAPGAVFTAEVQASNYCGPDPGPPVTVAFVLPEGLGRLVATPESADGLAGVPPCLGPGGPAAIEMRPWQP